MTRLSLPVASVAALAIALAGCGSSSSSSSGSSTSSTAAAASTTTAASTSGSTVDVVMKTLAFAPRTITAKVGETVHWTNDDSVGHNVSYVSGPKFTSSGLLDPGKTFSFKLTHAGTIHYVCTIHPFMTATIVVTQ